MYRTVNVVVSFVLLANCRDEFILLLISFPAILFLISPITLCTVLKNLLTQKQFCSLKNIHLPEPYIKNIITLLTKHITNLRTVCITNHHQGYVKL